VDAQWSIPHFEKMLYDNAALLALYADTARATGDTAYGDVARGIVGWLVREMRAGDGAFYSSLDADSEGEEGRFYVWSREQARAVLRDDEWQVAAPYYGLDGPPNFEGHAWNIRVVASVDEIAARFGLSLPDVQTRVAGARMALFKARDERVRPGRDDKVLTSWNALMIAALARAARALDQPKWADLAFTALDTLVRTAWRTAGSTRRVTATTSRSMPISTITRSCSRRCSRRCRRASADRTTISPSAWPTCCSIASRIASAADSGSRATITSGCSIAPSRRTTMPRRRATASRHRR
jgi:uncharacterized protein YyaL (SSP411 family)